MANNCNRKCSKGNKKCQNCTQNHSSLYKGCKKYKNEAWKASALNEAKQQKEEINILSTNTINLSDNVENLKTSYANIVKNQDNKIEQSNEKYDKVNSKLDSMTENYDTLFHGNYGNNKEKSPTNSNYNTIYTTKNRTDRKGS